jgi:transposase
MATTVIPTRYRLRVKQRLAVVHYAEEHGVKPAGRHFGLNRKTIRVWRDRWRLEGEAGLLPRYPARRRRRRLDDRMIALIKQARTEHRFGAGRARIWLDRVHQVRVTARTIQRVFRDLGLPYLTKTPRRRPRQLKLFEKDAPGDSVQVMSRS